jgi:bifunctional enzyme CysN/CysC
MSKNENFSRLHELLDRINIGHEGSNQVEDKPELSDQLAAYILWLDSEPMIPERTYSIHFEPESTSVQVTDLSFKIDFNTLSQLAAKKLEQDEIGYCKLSLGQKVFFDAYSDNQITGSFTIFDSLSNAMLGTGLIDFALRRAQNISWHETNINQETRSNNKHQRPCVLWFTGLSGSGKSTIADELEKKLYELGKHTMLLDGDNVRHGLNRDLGFTDQDRVENIRRIAEVSKLMVSSGLITIVSFISPFRAERSMARNLFNDGEFIEVFIDTPIEVCEARDSKGLYKKARAGKLKNFTGIDSDYEEPELSEIVLQNSDAKIDDLVNKILDYLRAHSKI